MLYRCGKIVASLRFLLSGVLLIPVGAYAALSTSQLQLVPLSDFGDSIDETQNRKWVVRYSRFVIPTDGSAKDFTPNTNFNGVIYQPGSPSSLPRNQRTNNQWILGLKAGFNRPGMNWIDIIPTEGTPARQDTNDQPEANNNANNNAAQPAAEQDPNQQQAEGAAAPAQETVAAPQQETQTQNASEESRFQVDPADLYTELGTNQAKPKPLSFQGVVKFINLWIWGGGYDYQLELYVTDSKEVPHRLTGSSLDYYGWKQHSVPIPYYIQQSFPHLPAVRPLTLDRIRLIAAPGEEFHSFYAYFDNLDIRTDLTSAFYDGESLDQPW